MKRSFGGLTRSARVPGAVCVTAALVALLAACSATTPSQTPSASTSGGVYQDPDYGFQVTVPSGFAQGSQHNMGISVTGNVSAARNVMFYDTKDVITHSDAPKDLPGASAIAQQLPAGASAYPVTFTVSVFPLGEPVTGDNLAAAKTELERNVVAQFTSAGLSATPLTATTVAGRPAFTTELTPSKAAKAESPMDFRTKVYWVFAESNEFQISEQAPATQWQDQTKTFDTMLSSVVLPGTWVSGSPSAAPSSSSSASG